MEVEFDQVKDSQLHGHKEVSTLLVTFGRRRVRVIWPYAHEPADVNIDHNILCLTVVFRCQNQACHDEPIEWNLTYVWRIKMA